MDTKKLFEKYRSKLVREGILKSFLVGLIAAFAVAAPIALVTSAHYFNQVFKLWYLVALSIGIAVGLIAAVIAYFVKFRPDTKKIARRVDELGLEERAITMLELSNDESYIAMKQREDAKARIAEASNKSMKFTVARPLIIAAIAVSVIGLLTTSLNVLATYTELTVIPSESEEYREYVTVTYASSDENAGKVICNEGGIVFKIKKGSDTTSPVCAVAENGYEFLYWMDENGNVLGEFPERQEHNVNKSITIYAVFGALQVTELADPGQAYDPYAYPKPDQIGDTPDKPIEDKDDTDNPQPWEPNNQIKDNNTSYYGEFLPEREDAMTELENNSHLTDKQKEGVGSYYDQLVPPEEQNK